MESWLLGTHVQCSEVERIQTSEPETGSSTCPSCHSLFLCLRKIQPLSPRLRFPFIKCGTVVQMRGNVSKNYLVQCLAHSKCLIKNSHYFMAYWIFDHSSTFSTFGQLPESSPVRRLDFSEVRNSAGFLGDFIGYFTPYPGTVPFPSSRHLEEETVDRLLGLWSGSGEHCPSWSFPLSKD